MHKRERYVRAAGAGSAIGGATLLAIFAWTEPALLLLVSGWTSVGQMSRRKYGSGWRGILPLAQLGLAAALFVATAAGGPLVVIVEAVFVVGWIAIAALIWSGHGPHQPIYLDGRPSYTAADTA